MIGSGRSPLYVARRWARRSRHTSVERFLDFLPGASKVSSGIERPYRLLKLAADRVRRRADRDGYTSISLGLELAALGRAIRRRPSLVHFLYADHDLHYFTRWAGWLRLPLVATLFFSIEELERRMPDRYHLRHVDLVLASGREQERFLARELGDRVAYLPLGVDCDYFSPADDSVPLASDSGTEPVRLLQVGINRRDFPTLCRVFRTVRADFDRVELHMVGCREVEDEFADLEGVVFHPFLDDEELRSLYRTSSLLVLPLLEGGSSNALNEALACGLPVVASGMPNLEDYTDSACVRMTPPGDPDAMAEACGAWLRDPAERKDAGKTARALALRYDWTVIASRLRSLYRERLGVKV